MACAPSPTTTAPVAPTPGPEAAAPMTPEAAPPVDPAMPSADACGALQYQALIGKPITEPGVPAEGPNVRAAETAAARLMMLRSAKPPHASTSPDRPQDS